MPDEQRPGPNLIFHTRCMLQETCARGVSGEGVDGVADAPSGAPDMGPEAGALAPIGAPDPAEEPEAAKGPSPAERPYAAEGPDATERPIVDSVGSPGAGSESDTSSLGTGVIRLILSVSIVYAVNSRYTMETSTIFCRWKRSILPI